MAITYLIGDATAPDGRGSGVIAHVCNDSGGWGKGFVLAISRRWPEPEAAYRSWVRSGQGFGLGMVQLVKVEDHLCVANMVAQHGYVSPANPVAIRYDALAQCLSKLAGRIGEGTIIHMPRIGCGLAGGSWDQIEPFLEEHLAMAGFDVRVYDLPATYSNALPRTAQIPEA
jgi:O-acetyl-ADP-ribose deacetylase (regulator of RNase III)